MLPPHPPAKPATGVLLHHPPGSCDIADSEVVRPAQKNLVELPHLFLLVTPHRSPAQCRADLIADRLDFLLGWGRSYIHSPRFPGSLRAEREAQKGKRLPRHGTLPRL